MYCTFSFLDKAKYVGYIIIIENYMIDTIKIYVTQFKT